MKRTVLLSISSLLVTLLLSVNINAGILSAGVGGKAAVSPALQIIANYTPMAKAGIAGNEIMFSADDFERALNLTRITSITINKVPSVTDGELFVGSVKLTDGQTISRSNISLMSYVAADDGVGNTDFSFSVNGSPYSIQCSLYMLDGINHSPTAAGGAREVGTYRDIAAFGRLYGADPEGDGITYQIVSYPEHGALMLTGNDGKYVYMPDAGFTGTDALRYVVYDCYGNYSAASEVKLSVEKNSASLAFDDMKWNEAYGAAVKMTSAGIMSGTQIGNGYYFYPDQTLSRAEFLVMAMRAAGINSLPEVENTGFYDDEDIPGAMKSYVGAAVRAGYIDGVLMDGKLCFLPDKAINGAEAAVMVANIMGVESDGSVAVSAMGSDVPAWAQDAVFALCGEGVLDDVSICGEKITRGDAAVMLAAMMNARK